MGRGGSTRGSTGGRDKARRRCRRERREHEAAAWRRRGGRDSACRGTGARARVAREGADRTRRRRGDHRRRHALALGDPRGHDGGSGRALVRRGDRAGDPLGRPVEARFSLLEDGRTSVVEMAEASGLRLVAEDERDAFAASTRGTGELIAAAVGAGASSVLVAVGGSATTDGGAGAIEAL